MGTAASEDANPFGLVLGSIQPFNNVAGILPAPFAAVIMRLVCVLSFCSADRVNTASFAAFILRLAYVLRFTLLLGQTVPLSLLLYILRLAYVLFFTVLLGQTVPLSLLLYCDWCTCYPFRCC